MFDSLGTWVERSWEQFKKFMNEQKTQHLAAITSLRLKKAKLEIYIEKIRLIDDMLGGSSLAGNPGSTSRTFDRKPTRVQSNLIITTEDGTKFLQGTLTGGDLPWQDQPPNMDANLGTRENDLEVAILVSRLKTIAKPAIRKRFEDNEYRLKIAMKKLEEIRYLISITEEIFKPGGYLEQYTEIIDSKFKQQSISQIRESGLTISREEVGKKISPMDIRSALFLDTEIQMDLEGNQYRGFPAAALTSLRKRLAAEIKEATE